LYILWCDSCAEPTSRISGSLYALMRASVRFLPG
jgi:hypothetical protein